jgi:hypothetical protein
LAPPRVSVTSSPGGLSTVWTGEEGLLKFRFERRTRIENGEIHCLFELTNVGETPLPLFWSSHDMVALDMDTRFELPEGTEMVVFQMQRVEFAPGVHRWPRFTLKDGRPVDLSRPCEVRAQLGRDFACKVFTREPVGPLRVHQGEDVLTLEADGTRAGLWINWGGGSPPGERYQLACPERCIGGPTDRVSEGLSSGDTEWLEPGGSESWSLRYRG